MININNLIIFIIAAFCGYVIATWFYKKVRKNQKGQFTGTLLKGTPYVNQNGVSYDLDGIAEQRGRSATTKIRMHGYDPGQASDAMAFTIGTAQPNITQNDDNNLVFDEMSIVSSPVSVQGISDAGAIEMIAKMMGMNKEQMKEVIKSGPVHKDGEDIKIRRKNNKAEQSGVQDEEKPSIILGEALVVPTRVNHIVLQDPHGNLICRPDNCFMLHGKEGDYPLKLINEDGGVYEVICPAGYYKILMAGIDGSFEVQEITIDSGAKMDYEIQIDNARIEEVERTFE